MITCTMFGMLGWAIATANGPGKLINTPSTKHGSTLSWGAVYGLQSIVGSQASGCLGQSDWTRYAKTPNAALFGQLVTAPITICVTAICGILITSAAATIYDQYIWNPFELLLTIQQNSLTPGARAGTFFAGLGFLCSQLALCIVLNCVSAGMDLAALCPKWSKFSSNWLGTQQLTQGSKHPAGVVLANCHCYCNLSLGKSTSAR